MAGLTAGGRRGALSSRLGQLPTGAKIFLILSAALLPFAIIAILATLTTTRQAGQEARSQLRVAAQESSRNLAIELVGDMTALTTTMNALAADHADAPSCARARGVFAQQIAAGAGFAISDRDGRLLCGTALPYSLPDAIAGGQPAARVVPGKGVVLATTTADGNLRGSAFFPAKFLAGIARPSGFGIDYAEAISGPNDQRLDLRTLDRNSPLDRHDSVSVPLNIGDLTAVLSISSNSITWPIFTAMLLPIIMWLAAASLAWLVVDRLLIQPLRTLRTRVAAYRPGEEIASSDVRSLPAQEIRELGETFRSLSRTLILHEAGLAEGLVRQTKLTREVHHRVKNNLQVISSLINLHSRGAKAEEAARAYSSIQRRVDALSVVHRHHFAEMEDHRGVSLRAVIGELASNIRATSPEGSRLGILLEVEPYLVSQDTAIAIAFLLTEIIELAISLNPAAQLRLSVRATDSPDHAILRASSPALIDGDTLKAALDQRYARVMEGLSRQLRAPLHHDPLTGAYEIAVSVTGKD
ncbi:MAG: histidine kinase [Sphingomonas sp.]|uniref:sensor histidine kinase n=1 Tax=Sphingomonas sp. TaxID=28214 RepID=UPI0012088C7D|nr:histidine kinase dimerization/phosphoacceptor domain -containing protein [Sphingomonas sp.]THD37709.1 MAG: histidine kinase [Sphingomonas sp.]